MQVSTNPFVKFCKLLKYDLWACARTFVPLYGALLALSVVAGFSIKSRHTFYKASNTFGEIMKAVYVIMFCIVIVATATTLIRRFKKNLLSSEGYLSLMLPVGISNHIWSKLVNNVIWCVLCLIVAFASVVLLSWQTGEARHFLSDLKYPLEQIIRSGDLLPTVTGILLVFANASLFCFAVMALGHLTQKYRIAVQIAAVIALSALESRSLDLLSTPQGIPDSLEGILYLVVFLLWSAFYFGITYFVLSRRLNLE